MDGIDGLARHNILSKSLLKGHSLGADDGVDLVCLPEFIGLDVKHILVDEKIRAQSQLELVRDEVRLVRLNCHLLFWGSVLATFEVATASATTTSATIASSLTTTLVATAVLSLSIPVLTVTRV